MTREDHLEALLREHGKADFCEIPDELPKWALRSSDARGANGGPWWDLGDEATELIKAVLNQEYPEDWPIERVYDLDTGQEYAIELDPRIVPA